MGLRVPKVVRAAVRAVVAQEEAAVPAISFRKRLARPHGCQIDFVPLRVSRRRCWLLSQGKLHLFLGAIQRRHEKLGPYTLGWRISSVSFAHLKLSCQGDTPPPPVSYKC